jgi:hypothetical protein
MGFPFAADIGFMRGIGRMKSSDFTTWKDPRPPVPDAASGGHLGAPDIIERIPDHVETLQVLIGDPDAERIFGCDRTKHPKAICAQWATSKAPPVNAKAFRPALMTRVPASMQRAPVAMFFFTSGGAVS